MKKNEKYIVEIIDQGFEGEGIAKIEGITVFIDGALKEEKVEVLILKVLTNYAYGKIVRIIKASDSRKQVDCISFQKCGGCSLRHMNYDSTLELKTSIVKNCLYKELHSNIDVLPCIGMKNPVGYRNKLLFPVGIDKNGNYIMGVYAKRSHNIISTENCYIQNEKNQKIANTIFEFIKNNRIKPYNEQKNEGLIRHIIIRNGFKTNEIMVIIVTKKEGIEAENKLVKEITAKYPEIKTIVNNINEKNTNVILGNKNKVLYGEGYIYDILGEYMFKISPMSFFQVNPLQTEILYNTAVNYANLKGTETVFDLFCGIGTIGIFASKKAKKVYGIETVTQAVENANENAKINNIKNAEFMLGNVEEILPKLTKRASADVVFLDPPRKGCDKDSLELLLKVEPKKIVYISCNPATLARDIAVLNEKYKLEKVQHVDMFPYTSHVECCSILKLR